MAFRSAILFSMLLVVIWAVMISQVAGFPSIKSIPESVIRNAKYRERLASKTFFVRLEFDLRIPGNIEKGRRYDKYVDNAHVTCYVKDGTSLNEVRPRRGGKLFNMIGKCKQTDSIFDKEITCSVQIGDSCEWVKGICEKLKGEARSNHNCPFGAYRASWDY